MRFRQALRALLGKSTPVAADPSWQFISPHLRPGVDGDLTVAALLRSSAVVSCAGLISDTLAAAPINVVQRLPSGGLRQVTQSSANDALLTLTYDDRAAALFGCLTRGNGFWSRQPDGSLRALDSARTMAYVDPQGKVWIKQQSDPYIPYASVAHLRFRVSPGFVLGYSPAMLAADSIMADLGIVRMASAMARNASVPALVALYPGVLSDEALTRIKKSWHASHGEQMQGSFAVLEEGMTLEQLKPPSATDAQMVEALTWSATDICRLYNVPPTLVGLMKDSNKATSTEENRAFYARCLKPWSARITDVLGRLLLSDAERKAGLRIETDLSELALGEGKERADYLRALVLSSILTPSEARNSIGYEDITGGDKLLAPVNMVPADQLGVNDAGTGTAS